MLASSLSPETLHPSLWRGSQLSRGGPRTVDTGFAALSAELPGGGWPVGALVELLAAQPGCGEMRLLAPALARAVSARRPLAFVAPPQSPHAGALAELGVPLDAMMWLRAGRGADALWAAEQALKTGCCGALLFWQPDVRADALRRLHLAAALHARPHAPRTRGRIGDQHDALLEHGAARPAVRRRGRAHVERQARQMDAEQDAHSGPPRWAKTVRARAARRARARGA